MAVLPRASPAPHCARWLARVARLRATALALSGDEAQHVRFRSARAAPQWRLAQYHMEGHCTREKPPFLRRQPVLPRASPAPHFARWLARVARLRAAALALSGDEAQYVRFRRACAALRWRHSPHARWKGTARARSRRSFGASPFSHVPALPITARGGLRVFRTSRTPRRTGGTRSINYGRALHEQKAAVPSAHGRAPTCQPCPSLREVAWACNALARLFARSLRELGPARSHPTRASAAPRWRHSLNALCKGTTRARSRCSFGAS